MRILYGILSSLPHARGGVSSAVTFATKLRTVFPTLVGVFPLRFRLESAERRLPHARGGVSRAGNEGTQDETSSPRSWGCFCQCQAFRLLPAVFPTLVGVFPLGMVSDPASGCLPHARGGVSACRLSKMPSSGVFPTLVGVFLLTAAVPFSPSSLPHARGGVSKVNLQHHYPESSSPRSWGCFPLVAALVWLCWVFPTLVGVFLTVDGSASTAPSLPHARGGVSTSVTLGRFARASSPRSWGCF